METENKVMVRSLRMDWSIPDVTYASYLNTLHGQIEYWVMWMFLGQFERIHHFPPYWYGAHNSIVLYLEHVFYSPFLDHPSYGKPHKCKTTWDMRNVPPDQEELVTKDFIPLLTNKEH